MSEPNSGVLVSTLTGKNELLSEESVQILLKLILVLREKQLVNGVPLSIKLKQSAWTIYCTKVSVVLLTLKLNGEEYH